MNDYLSVSSNYSFASHNKPKVSSLLEVLYEKRYSKIYENPHEST